MRQALYSSHAFNDMIEPQRVGFSVEVSDGTGVRFVCSIEEGDKALGYAMWRGGKVGFCRASGAVTIYNAFYKAQEIAIKVGGRVVTVPRVVGEMAAGVVRVWEDAVG
jgi:hypothetical protein